MVHISLKAKASVMPVLILAFYNQPRLLWPMTVSLTGQLLKGKTGLTPRALWSLSGSAHRFSG